MHFPKLHLILPKYFLNFLSYILDLMWYKFFWCFFRLKAFGTSNVSTKVIKLCKIIILVSIKVVKLCLWCECNFYPRSHRANINSMNLLYTLMLIIFFSFRKRSVNPKKQVELFTPSLWISKKMESNFEPTATCYWTNDFTTTC